MARTFDHPLYGRTVSPAAELVVGWLRRAGFAAAVSEPGQLGETEQSRWLGVAYIDPRLGPVGLAVTASAGAPEWQRAARAALVAWQRTLGTRRVLLPDLPCANVPGQRGASDAAPDPAVAAQRYLDEGDSVLVLGEPTAALRGLHPAAHQRVVYAGRQCTFAESVLHEVNGDRLSFVMSPDVVAEDASVLLHAARRRFPHLRGQHPDHWPYRSSDRFQALRLAVDGADEVWVLTSPGPRHPLLDAALSHSPVTCREFGDPTDIEEHWLTPRLRSLALVTSSLSDPEDGRRREVLRLLSGTGPIGVVTRDVSTRIATEAHLPVLN
ncbi:hypothetical protein [Kitasatospora albolonga]|uniref:hypothetical protein n=1 Tax=Kitasatospora albolonga TaxID=68173 RepID=UPI0035EFDD93